MSQTAHRVHLVEGNATVHRLMAEALEGAGFFVQTEVDDELADLLVVDVDSGLEGAAVWRQSYTGEQRPVLICGLRHSREDHGDDNWLERPFAPEGFVALCRELLGIEETPTLEDEVDDESQFPGLHADSTPDTRKLTVEDAEELEAELGLEEGALLEEAVDDDDARSLADTDNLKVDDEDVLEIDTSSSIVLDVDDLEDVRDDAVREQPSLGGALGGDLARQRLADDELEWEEPELDPPVPLRSSTLNQTMPDAPAVMGADEVDDAPSALEAFPEPPIGDAPSSHGSVAQLTPQMQRQVDRVASLLGDSWGRIGLAARPGDRSEHIRKVLVAIFSEGMTAATAELERIPGAEGFCGSLRAISVIELVRTVRDRGLRGRLEVAVGQDDYVVYLDGSMLDGIERLSGSDDALLLDILLEMGRLPQQLYDELNHSLSDELAAPVTMRIRDDEIVTTEDLQTARRTRAVRLFGRLRARDDGNFAFMEVETDAGHAWPANALGIGIDALLEEVARRDSDVADDPDATREANVIAPAGLEIDNHLPATVEVPDPDGA